MSDLLRSSVAILFLVLSSHAQTIITSQNNTFNSSFTLSQPQIDAVGINSTIASNINVAVNFERSNWATGSVDSDPFYSVPSNSSSFPAGSLIKLQTYVNTSTYTLPPDVALSRIIYQTETLNGTTVPASAYILWPYLAHSFPNITGHPLVAFAHGTSGVFPECGPSHIRNLWYQYSAPYSLALAGYVVVATDYAGLGVSHDAHGNEVRHPYLANPAAANDVFFSVQAAQEAFPELSKEFVVVGHSQGGGAAWACAERQGKRPVAGYLGTVAASPITDMAAWMKELPNAALNIAPGLTSILPDFQIEEWLTPSGIAKTSLLKEVGGCSSVAGQISSSDDEEPLFHPDWANSSFAARYAELTTNGNAPPAGPMLVIQGAADTATGIAPLTDKVVNETCQRWPESRIEYRVFEGVGHVPVMYAGMRGWIEWVGERFGGIGRVGEDGHGGENEGCKMVYHRPVRPVEDYQMDLGFYLEYASMPGYETA
ncbi:secretory lipase [Aulographum hederae CBS 113979]|uniref:Secretory lipase n=1 Tax=Aulographum hederae CBS 113979 TaxID=1176131 RepID=A0A6G1GSD6_9PEZI|nr:secretory lipase [Aulographum hederae CBS 113979]